MARRNKTADRNKIGTFGLVTFGIGSIFGSASSSVRHRNPIGGPRAARLPP
jgi:hypothetical protein